MKGFEPKHKIRTWKNERKQKKGKENPQLPQFEKLPTWPPWPGVMAGVPSWPEVHPVTHVPAAAAICLARIAGSEGGAATDAHSDSITSCTESYQSCAPRKMCFPCLCSRFTFMVPSGKEGAFSLYPNKKDLRNDTASTEHALWMCSRCSSGSWCVFSAFARGPFSKYFTVTSCKKERITVVSPTCRRRDISGSDITSPGLSLRPPPGGQPGRTARWGLELCSGSRDTSNLRCLLWRQWKPLWDNSQGKAFPAISLSDSPPYDPLIGGLRVLHHGPLRSHPSLFRSVGVPFGKILTEDYHWEDKSKQQRKIFMSVKEFFK